MLPTALKFTEFRILLKSGRSVRFGQSLLFLFLVNCKGKCKYGEKGKDRIRKGKKGRKKIKKEGKKSEKSVKITIETR